ncbi:MAG: hydantoinase B/oxoprolinase family protein, partial [Candidatus Omnitrophica bacterium]|nr:hydantoinase B/oxoprolinase family protein [Candidatus Omnitrophota bacterium]
VHTHMTNTRITDPEILESRFPVRLETFGIRPSSGGKGRYRGGNGIIRSFIFLKELDVSLLTERRTKAPFGLKGGGSGQCGKNVLVLADGIKQPLNGRVSMTVHRGDRLEILTPGGGGYGKKDAA